MKSLKLLFFLFLLSPAAYANIIYQFNGKLTSVPTELSSYFTSGDSFTETITVDSRVPDSNPSTDRGIYSNSIINWVVEIGSLTMVMPSDALLKRTTVSFDGTSTTRWDQFYFDAWANSTRAIFLDDWGLDNFHQDFVAVNDPYFTRDALPTVFDPSHFFHTNTYMDLRFRDTDNSTIFLRGRVETASVETSSIAEPVTLALMGLGLASIGYRRRNAK